MNIDLPVLHAIAKVAEAQPVHVKVGLRTWGLTFTCIQHEVVQEQRVLWNLLMEHRTPVEHCTRIIDALVINVQRYSNGRRT